MPLAKPPAGSLLNPTHPLARGLVGAWMFNEGAGNSVRNSVGPLHGTRAGTAPPSWSSGVYGRDLLFDSTQTSQAVGIPDPAGRFAGMARLTVATVLNCTGFGAGNAGRAISQNGNSWFLLVSGGGIGSQFQIPGASATINFDYGGLNTGYKTIVGTYDGATVRLYRNGVQIGTTAGTGSVAANATGIAIGNNTISGGVRGFQGNIAGAWVSSVAWPDSQIEQFSADPFAMFRRSTITIFGPTGPIDYSLTAQNLTAGTPTVGSPAISQNHTVTATALASGSPTVGTPAITQTHTLTAVALATGTPTVGTPILTQVHELTAVSIVTGSPTLGNPAVSAGTVPPPGSNQANPLPGARDEWRFWHHREPITLRSLTGAGIYTSHAVSDAKPRAITIREASASGGVYTTQDRTWLIPTVLISDNVAPKPGDVVRQANNTDWTVLAVDPLGKFGNTYRLTTRNLIVFAALTQTARILRPTQAVNAIGQRSPTFTEVYANLVVRIQEQTHTIPELQGGATDRRDYVMYVGTRLTLRAGDIVESGGLRYDVMGAGNWDRLDQLGEVRLSKAGVL